MGLGKPHFLFNSFENFSTIKLHSFYEGEAEIMSSVGQDRDTDNINPVVSLLWLSRNSIVSVHSSGFIRLFTADMRKYQLTLKKVKLNENNNVFSLDILSAD